MLAFLMLSSGYSQAAHVNCIGAYVGRIDVSAAEGLKGVVFLSHYQNTGGSYWVGFSGWDDGAKKEALSILMAAKLARHRVDVYTTAADGCRIGYPAQTLKNVMLSTNQ